MSLQENKEDKLKEEDFPLLVWTKEIDVLLASWCDNAKCFEWMHGETSIDYQKRSKIFMDLIQRF